MLLGERNRKKSSIYRKRAGICARQPEKKKHTLSTEDHILTPYTKINRLKMDKRQM